MSAAVVLLSGGQDSTTCLYWAKAKFDEVYALTLFYGQRHETEIEAAREIASMADCQFHQEFDLTVLREIGDSALVTAEEDITQPISVDNGYKDEKMPEGLPTSFVPGRNMLFLGVAASWAVRMKANAIVTGVCQTDYSGYPDCRQEFITAMAVAIQQAMPSSCLPLNIHTPLMNMSKAQSVALARGLDGCWEALALSVTCYNGLRPGCGECPACVLRAQGFAQAGEEDPNKMIFS